MLKIEKVAIPDAPVTITPRMELRPYSVNEYILFYQTIDTQDIGGFICMSPDSYDNETDDISINIPGIASIEVGKVKYDYGILWDFVTVASGPADRMRVQALGHGFKISVNDQEVLTTQHDSGELWWATIKMSAWHTYRYLLPYTINLRLDESLDSAVVQRLTDSAETLPPLTKVQLIDGDITRDYVVENAPTERIGFDTFQQTLELVEPTEWLKGLVPDNLTVTQPLNPDIYHPKMKLSDVIDRVLIITPTVLLSKIDKTLTAMFELDPVIRAKFELIEAPDFEFEGYTLFDILVDIGMFVDMFPRVVFGNYVENSKMMITFDELDPIEKDDYSVVNQGYAEIQQPLCNYANEVVTDVRNLAADIEVTYPGKDLGVYVSAPEGQQEITNENAVIALPYKIKKILKLEGYFKESVLGSYKWHDMTDFVYEYSKWVTLGNLEGSTPEEYINTPYTMYYKENDRCIYNVDNYFKQTGQATPRMTRNAIFRVTYVPYLDTVLKEKNRAEKPYTVIYNQNNKVIDEKLMGKHLQMYINRMEGKDLIISKVYDKIEDFPKLGHIANDHVLTNLTYSRLADGAYEATLQLSDKYTRRAEFIRAKNEFRTWEIPGGNSVVRREITIKEQISISSSLERLQKFDKENSVRVFDTVFVERFFWYITTSGSAGLRTKFKTNYFAGLEFKCRDNSIIPLMMMVASIDTGKRLEVRIEMIDNTVAGYSKSKSAIGMAEEQQGVTYTDSYGNIEALDLAIGSRYFMDWFDIKEIAQNYPLASGAQMDYLFQVPDFILINIVIKKDAREQLSVIYSVDTIIQDDLYIKTFPDTEISPTIKFLFLDIDIEPNTLITDDIINGALREKQNFTFDVSQYAEDVTRIRYLFGATPEYDEIKSVVLYRTGSREIVMLMRNISTETKSIIGQGYLYLYVK